MLFAPQLLVPACCAISNGTGLPAVISLCFLLHVSHNLHVNLLDSIGPAEVAAPLVLGQTTLGLSSSQQTVKARPSCSLCSESTAVNLLQQSQFARAAIEVVDRTEQPEWAAEREEYELMQHTERKVWGPRVPGLDQAGECSHGCQARLCQEHLLQFMLPVP